MMKKIIIVMSVLLANIECALCTNNVENELRLPQERLIALNKISAYAKKIANDYLATLGHSIKTLNPTLKKAVNQALSDTHSFFKEKARNTENKKIAKKDIEEDVIVKLKSLVTSITSMINKLNLDEKVEECFSELCHAQNVDHENIPETMLDELNTKKQRVKELASELIDSKKNQEITAQELYAILSDTLVTFIERAQYGILWKLATMQIEDISRKNQIRSIINPSSHIPHNGECEKMIQESWFIRKRMVMRD